MGVLFTITAFFTLYNTNMFTTIAAKPPMHLRRVRFWLSTILVVILAGYSTAVAFLPAPAPVLDQTVFSSSLNSGQQITIDWPESQQAAIGALGQGILASYGDEGPLPMASVAKIVTALAILKKHHLELGQSGPAIRLTQDDVAIYRYYIAIGGSVAPVVSGEEVSLYQALQIMLIPSANNMAKSLAIWAFGSEQAYAEYANTMLGELGLKNTTVVDATGISEGTVSTAQDLVLLGQHALNDPVIAQIATQTEATIPVTGRVVSTNKVMGMAGINGLKTGHTDASGGCFLFTAAHEIDGEQVKLIGAIMAAPSIESALNDAPKLVELSETGFQKVVALSAGQQVATVNVPWAAPVSILVKDDLKQVVWKGTELKMDLSLDAGLRQGEVGSASMSGQSIALIQTQDIPQPDYWWRFTHPIELVGAL